jgi:hypothetical protein
MPKHYDIGGVNRTIKSTCGWSCYGSLREANGKLKIHKRVCETCRRNSVTIPAYDSKSKINGYNRFNRQGYNSHAFVTVAENDMHLPMTMACNLQQANDKVINAFISQAK